jgi:hypothetical protein
VDRLKPAFPGSPAWRGSRGERSRKAYIDFASKWGPSSGGPGSGREHDHVRGRSEPPRKKPERPPVDLQNACRTRHSRLIAYEGEARSPHRMASLVRPRTVRAPSAPARCSSGGVLRSKIDFMNSRQPGGPWACYENAVRRGRHHLLIDFPRASNRPVARTWPTTSPRRACSATSKTAGRNKCTPLHTVTRRSRAVRSDRWNTHPAFHQRPADRSKSPSPRMSWARDARQLALPVVY